jgi:hypothetical protein
MAGAGRSFDADVGGDGDRPTGHGFLLDACRPRARALGGILDRPCRQLRGAIAVFVDLVIALSQLRMRRELDDAGAKPAARLWAFPALTWLSIGFIAGL